MNREEYKNGLLLGGSTAIALLIITLAFQLTKAPIENTAKKQLQSNLDQLLKTNSYNNNPAEDIVYQQDANLGSNEPLAIYRARLNDKPTGIVITAVAPDGYNGPINLLIGLDIAGNVVAVRVTRHNETPGLGDDIDVRRSDWIHSFADLSPSKMTPADWQVKKDGGQFDQFTGATITPRAVIKAVDRVTTWYQKNKGDLFIESAPIE